MQNEKELPHRKRPQTRHASRAPGRVRRQGAALIKVKIKIKNQKEKTNSTLSHSHAVVAPHRDSSNQKVFNLKSKVNKRRCEMRLSR